MSAEDMHEAARCQHVRVSGKQCKAPARRGTNYCLFHEAEHVNSAKLTFPPVEDGASVAVATDQVIQALRDDTIEFRRAGLLLSGLRLARINLKQLGLELGDPVEAAPAAKIDKREEALQAMPSLAEFVMERLDEFLAEEAQERGEPAPERFDVAAAEARGETLAEMVMGRLRSLGFVEEEEKQRLAESGVRHPESGVGLPESGVRMPATEA